MGEVFLGPFSTMELRVKFGEMGLTASQVSRIFHQQRIGLPSLGGPRFGVFLAHILGGHVFYLSEVWKDRWSLLLEDETCTRDPLLSLVEN